MDKRGSLNKEELTHLDILKIKMHLWAWWNQHSTRQHLKTVKQNIQQTLEYYRYLF